MLFDTSNIDDYVRNIGGRPMIKKLQNGCLTANLGRGILR